MAYNKEYFKQWYEKNKERKNASSRAWYENHKEFVREYTYAWRQAHPDRCKEYSHRAYVKKRKKAEEHMDEITGDSFSEMRIR